MKIKDTRVAEKLPPIFEDTEVQYKISVLNTDIDINEVAEVDVEKVTKIIEDYQELSGKELDAKYGTQFLEDAIAKSGCLKWREK